MLEFQLRVPILYKFKVVGYSQEWHLFIYQYQSTLIRETWSLQHFGGEEHYPQFQCQVWLLGPAVTMEILYLQPSSTGFQMPLCLWHVMLSLENMFTKTKIYNNKTCFTSLSVCLFCLLTCLFVCLYSHCIKPDCSCSVLYCDLLGIAIYCDI